MKNLERFGVQELNVKEIITIDGGNRFIKAWELIKKVGLYAGLYDMASDFAEGFNEGCLQAEKC